MKVNRLVSIIMILLDKKRISAQELSEMFEVSRRTIYRDVEAINLAGIPIRSTPGVGGGFEIMENYKIDQTFFSTDDLTAILTGLANVTDLIEGSDLANAVAKVRSFVPTEKAAEIAFKTNQIKIDLSPWMGNRNLRRALEIIKEALQERRVLSFDYVDRHGEKNSRSAEPYQIVLKGSNWYWQGYCLKRDAYRLFRVSRMSDLRLEEANFTPRTFEPPLLDFDDELAAIQQTIKLRIHRSIRDLVLDHCAFDNFTQEDEDHYLVDFPFIENDFYYNILFSFGDRCECLAPAQVRSEMRQRVAGMMAVYEG